MSEKSINGHSYASVFFDFAIATNGLRRLLRHWPLSVFLCIWGKMSLLSKIQTAGRPPCEIRQSGGQPQHLFSRKLQTRAPCKSTGQWQRDCRGSFLHCILFLKDTPTAMEVLTFPSSADPDILSSVASCKRGKCTSSSQPLGKLCHHMEKMGSWEEQTKQISFVIQVQ